MPLYQVPYDKAQHVIYGAVVAVAAVMVLVAWNWMMVWLPLPRMPRAMIPLVAFAASFLVGWLYERWQELQNTRAVARNQPPPHNIEVKDVQHTGYGGALVALPVLLGMLV